MPESPFALDGRVALVTGGNSGLGRDIARALRDQGASVAIGGRRAERNAEVLAELGLQHSAHELDVADEASVRDAIAATVRRYGRWTFSSTMPPANALRYWSSTSRPGSGC
jgi:NAD(P)-dependent dehydrogenase (short-subunit alcohol dehydrogenase family)